MSGHDRSTNYIKIAVNTIQHHSASKQCRAIICSPAKLHSKWRFTCEPLARYCMLTGYFLLQKERLVGEDENGSNNLQLTSSGIYTRVPTSNIYIFSVVAINSTEEHVWDIFTVNVWIYQQLSSNSLRCCFLYKRNVVMRKGILTSIPRAKAQP